MKPMRRHTSIHATLAKLAAAERAFLRAEFLAPALRGRRVGVRIAGVVCQMEVTPRTFEGFGVFRPTSHARARLEREATLGERRRYLDLLPRVFVVLCEADRDGWLAINANAGDERFDVDGVIDVRLVDADAGLQPFETAVARF